MATIQFGQSVRIGIPEKLFEEFPQLEALRKSGVLINSVRVDYVVRGATNITASFFAKEDKKDERTHQG